MYENGYGARTGKAVQTMPIEPYRRDLRGGQGFYVSVYTDKMVVERIDIEEDCAQGADSWIIPLGSSEKPYDFDARAAASVAPEFPADAAVRTETRNTDNRIGLWTIAMNCEFESAVAPRGTRVYDYEIRAVQKDGSVALVKRFISPAFAKMPKYEPDMMRVWFNVAELPQDKDYVLEVRARNCFGKYSKPIVSRVWHSVPGLDKARH
jgi:hypothetical protein